VDGGIGSIDLARGKITRLRPAHDGPISALLLVGERVVAIGGAACASVHDRANLRQVGALGRMGDTVDDVRFLPDGGLAWVDIANVFREVQGGRETERALSGPSVTTVRNALLPRGDLAIVSGGPGTLGLVETGTGRVVGTNALFQRPTWISRVVISPDGRSAFAVAMDGSLVALSLPDLTIARRVSLGRRPLHALDISTDGSRVVVGGSDPSLEIWDPRTGETVERIADEGVVWTVAISRDAQRVLCGTFQGESSLRVLETKERRLLGRRVEAVTAAAFSPSGHVVLVAARDLAVRVIDGLTGDELDRIDLSNVRDDVSAIAFSEDGRSFLLGTFGGRVLRFDLR
jgi:WD40 repeat protein